MGSLPVAVVVVVTGSRREVKSTGSKKFATFHLHIDSCSGGIGGGGRREKRKLLANIPKQFFLPSRELGI